MADVKKRNLTIDLIKVFAILGVVIIHMDSAVLTQTPVNSFEWLCGLFWGTFFRASVPLFLMASGAVMLEPAKPLSLKKLYFHNIARILVAMLFWGLLYKFFHLAAYDQLNVPDIWHAVKRLILFDQEFHFYYIHMILICYAFLPVTRFFAEKADKKLMLYGIGLWIIFGIIYPSVLPYKPFNLLGGITDQWRINLAYSSIGYSLLGYYLKKNPISLKKSLLCIVAGIVFSFSATLYLSVRSNELNEMFLQGTTPGIFLMAIGFFSLASYINIKEKIAGAIVYVSKASFLVYLCHMIIIYVMQYKGITSLIMPAVISVPLLSVGVILLVLVIYAVLSRIPVVKNWII